MADSLASSAAAQRSDIETTVIYSARDSMFFDLENQEVFMYGDSKIDYGDIKLDAERIRVNWVNKTIQANFVVDSTGRKVGKPVFTDKQDVYETDDIVYNFNTRKAVIKGVITEQDNAFMHGELVKKNEHDEMFIRNAGYTTCNQAEPHFHIQSNTLKVIPSKKIISGPFNLRFGDIPTFLWLPFGMFPQPKSKSSGILVPTWGEERVRGFFLRDGGYYFAINDYVDLRLTGDIYSKGGFGVRAASNYRWRYHFNGSFNFNLTRTQGATIDTQDQIRNDYSLRWSHTPQSFGASSFSASVNIQSSSYNTNNNQALNNLNRSITSQFASNVSYRNSIPRTPWNLSANLRHRQNVATGKVDVTFPEVTVGMNRIYPLKKIFTNSKSPLNKLSLSHNLNMKNDLTNIPTQGSLPFDVLQEQEISDTLTFQDDLREIFRQGKFGARHTIPITTSFNMFKFFTVSPAFNYEEIWYTKKLSYEYLEETENVDVDTVNSFQRLSSYSASASMNTTFYGQVFINGKRIQAIRHVVQPSVSFSFRPDLTKEFSQDVQTGEDTFREVSQYQGFLFGAPTGGRSMSMNFNIRNNLEMKIRSKKDTVNEFTKVKIFDNLSITSGYDFARDSLNLNDIRWNARTSLFKNAVSIALNGALDPYTYVLESETINANGERVVRSNPINKFAWNTGNGIGTLSSISTNISFSLKPKGAKKSEETNASDYGRQGDFADTDFTSSYGTEEELAYINANPEEYVDFKIPWALRVQYNIGRTKNGLAPPVIRQTLNFNGNISITKKTKITFSSSYDFEANEFAATRLSVNRDLHCWVLDLSWVPFGFQQSYSVTLRARASILQDLKLQKRRNNRDFFN